MAQPPQKESPELSNMLEDVLGILRESSNLEQLGQPEDVQAVVKHMEKSLAELTERAEQLYAATGMNKEQLQQFSENPENFTEAEWALLTQVRNEVQKFQEEAERGMHESIDKTTAAVTASHRKPSKKGKSKSSSKRVKRKNWMSG
jgi:hypothetical protein